MKSPLIFVCLSLLAVSAHAGTKQTFDLATIETSTLNLEMSFKYDSNSAGEAWVVPVMDWDPNHESAPEEGNPIGFDQFRVTADKTVEFRATADAAPLNCGKLHRDHLEKCHAKRGKGEIVKDRFNREHVYITIQLVVGK